jgi:hypothetical protein
MRPIRILDDFASSCFFVAPAEPAQASALESIFAVVAQRTGEVDSMAGQQR